MKLAAANQPPEVPGVFGNDDPIFGDAPLDDTTVRLAAPADMQRMNCIVTSRCVEARRQLLRQALVDDKRGVACNTVALSTIHDAAAKSADTALHGRNQLDASPEHCRRFELR